ncbi:MAG TPA: KTSC domain-containing protein [Firmicutes bacterium]|nr:KTSC domain-containing protein [Bacillota bacterium]
MEFNKGGVHQYLDVPKEEYPGLLDVSSNGAYFNTSTGNVYTYVRIELSHGLEVRVK